ncbi:hypothetical protein KBTX_03477 [wastewater metagenome]|uniref:PepSY domain-containing protein n=2 Tax=unclassified sequences TaxID=12908 RepID=A0A5B8RHR2_9ZZZZ|nr:hypothetical protein KBTEX_03477 [uncultured organism]
MKGGLVLSMVMLGVAAAGAAQAADGCDVPKSEWQSRDTFRQALMDKGWEVKSIRTEDGCYEAYAYDENGDRVEAYFNPKTLEPVRVKEED